MQAKKLQDLAIRLDYILIYLLIELEFATFEHFGEI